MTEEQIREIVRDEIYMEANKEGGILDDARKHSFAITRAIIEQVAKNAIEMFGPEPSRAPEREEHEKLN